MADNGQKTSAKVIVTREMMAVALKHRKEGKTFQQIADAIGLKSAQHAHLIVKKALKAVIQEPTEELIKTELERMDDLWQKAYAVLTADHLLIQKGMAVVDPRTVVDPEAGAEGADFMRDNGPVLAAIDRLLKIQDQRAKLLGLNKPTKVEAKVEGEISTAPAVQFYIPDNGRDKTNG